MTRNSGTKDFNPVTKLFKSLSFALLLTQAGCETLDNLFEDKQQEHARIAAKELKESGSDAMMSLEDIFKRIPSDKHIVCFVVKGHKAAALRYLNSPGVRALMPANRNVVLALTSESGHLLEVQPLTGGRNQPAALNLNRKGAYISIEFKTPASASSPCVYLFPDFASGLILDVRVTGEKDVVFSCDKGLGAFNRLERLLPVSAQSVAGGGNRLSLGALKK